MTFYVIDPKGYRLPYTPDDFRVMRRGSPAKAVEAFTDRPVTKWPEQEEGSKRDSLESIFSSASDKQTATPITAKQIMKRNIKSVTPTTTLRQTWELLAKNRFRHLPVLDEEKLVGIISDRRLCREMINRLYKSDKDLKVPIGEIMVTHVLTATPNTSIAEIAAIFLQERIGSMPIVNSESKLVGIITRSDILRTLVRG